MYGPHVESGDILEFTWGGAVRIGMVADRGGAGGWRIVIIRGSRVGTIVLGNDCQDARVCMPAGTWAKLVRDI